MGLELVLGLSLRGSPGHLDDSLRLFWNEFGDVSQWDCLSRPLAPVGVRGGGLLLKVTQGLRGVGSMRGVGFRWIMWRWRR